MKTNKTKDLIFFLLKEEQKHKTNKTLVGAISQARRDLTAFKNDETDEALYAYVWETFAAAAIAYHDWGKVGDRYTRYVFSQLVQRLEQ